MIAQLREETESRAPCFHIAPAGSTLRIQSSVSHSLRQQGARLAGTPSHTGSASRAQPAHDGGIVLVIDTRQSMAARSADSQRRADRRSQVRERRGAGLHRDLDSEQSVAPSTALTLSDAQAGQAPRSTPAGDRDRDCLPATLLHAQQLCGDGCTTGDGDLPLRRRES